MTFISCNNLLQETTAQIPEAPCDPKDDDTSKHHNQDKDQDNDLPDLVNSVEATASMEKQHVEEQPIEKDLPSTTADIGKEL